MPRLKRFDIKKLLENPDLRRRLVVNSTIATQAREGIDVSKEEAENSYYVVTEGEHASFFPLSEFRTDAGESDGRHIELVRFLNQPVDSLRLQVALRDFSALEHAPLAYRDLSLIGTLFVNNARFDSLGEAWQGVISRDDERYFRSHWEVTPNKHQKPWVTLFKGGEYCRFYFDSPLVINWSSAAQEGFHRLRDTRIYFREGVTWPRRTQRGFSARFMPNGCVFSDKGPTFLPHEPSQIWIALAILNSRIAEFMMKAITSFGSWELGAVKRLPYPPADESISEKITVASRSIYDAKSTWDTGNEICTRFDRPWVLQTAINGDAATLSAALDAVLDHEAEVDAELESTYARLNDAVYRLYGVNDKLKIKLEEAIGQRPPEIVWPQMEGKDRDQKRREHVDRLLLFLVKRVVEADADGLISFESVDHEPPLLERLRKELHACFPQQDPNALETEVINELKKKTKGYRRAESLTEWLQDAFFDTHCTLYQQRPLLWHLASHQVRRVPAIGLLVHAHKFNADALAKLRSVHIRDRLTALRREAGQADRDGRQDDRIQALSDIEEVEAFDAKLKLLQEGQHTGPEGGERDYRILTPWKSASERPQGWHPDLDDGIKVNIAPLSRTGLLRKALRFAQAENED